MGNQWSSTYPKSGRLPRRLDATFVTVLSSTGTIFVVRITTHVTISQSICFFYKRAFVEISQCFPHRTQLLTNLGVVQFGIFQCQTFTLRTGPDHECVHWTFDSLVWSPGSPNHGVFVCTRVVNAWRELRNCQPESCPGRTDRSGGSGARIENLLYRWQCHLGIVIR